MLFDITSSETMPGHVSFVPIPTLSGLGPEPRGSVALHAYDTSDDDFDSDFDDADFGDEGDLGDDDYGEDLDDYED